MQSFNDIWTLALGELNVKFGQTIADLWFTSLKLFDLTDTQAVIVCDMPYKYKIIKNKYADSIAEALEKVVGFSVEVVIVDKNVDPIEYSMYVRDSQNPRETVNLADTVIVPTVIEETDSSGDGISEAPRKRVVAGSHGEYTFENFIVGQSNKFAHAASVAVANEPACLNNREEMTSEYNPLFIYGPSGLGKTHLLYAIINQIKLTRPELKIVYVKGEQFTSELIDSLSKKTPELFREKYRTADVLLIDDIQFIAGRTSTQEEFFHTFNALYEDHKQIILTSDRPAKDIKTLEDRLKTRFEWGIHADIQPPDADLRAAIIQKKAAAINISLDIEVVNYLAENLKSNIRQIEGAIKKLGALSILTGAPITVELAKNSIADLITVNESPETTIDRIIDTVSKKFGIPVEEIRGTKRTREIANARHISIYLIRKLTNLSLPQIGKMLKRDHATIMSSLKVVEKQLGANTQIDNDVSELLKELKG